jgi:hypothetical protein
MTICTLEEMKRRVRRHEKTASDMNHTQRQHVPMHKNTMLTKDAGTSVQKLGQIL